MSQFVLGIGNTLYYSLGPTYIDNNTKQHNTPLMLSYAYAMRIFGPVLGYCFAYVVLRVYIDPTLTPLIPKSDARWMGAWWLGWIIIGCLKFIFAFLMGLFPNSLKKAKTLEQLEMENKNDEKTLDEGDVKGVGEGMSFMIENR